MGDVTKLRFPERVEYVVVQRALDCPLWVVLLRKNNKEKSAPQILKTKFHSTAWFHYKKSVDVQHPAVNRLDWGDSVFVYTCELPRNSKKPGFWVHEGREEIETESLAIKVMVEFHKRTKEERRVNKVDVLHKCIRIDDGFVFDETRASETALRKLKKNALADCEFIRFKGAHWVSESKRFAFADNEFAPEELKKFCTVFSSKQRYWSRIYVQENPQNRSWNRHDGSPSKPPFTWQKHSRRTDEVDRRKTTPLSPDSLAENGELVEMDVDDDDDDDEHNRSFRSDDSKENYMSAVSSSSSHSSGSSERFENIEFVIDNSKPEENSKLQIEFMNNGSNNRKVTIESADLPSSSRSEEKEQNDRNTSDDDQPDLSVKTSSTIDQGDKGAPKQDERPILAPEQTGCREERQKKTEKHEVLKKLGEQTDEVNPTSEEPPTRNSRKQTDCPVGVATASPTRVYQSPSEEEAVPPVARGDRPRSEHVASVNAAGECNKDKAVQREDKATDLENDSRRSPVAGIPPPPLSKLPPDNGESSKQPEDAILGRPLRLADPRKKSVNFSKNVQSLKETAREEFERAAEERKTETNKRKRRSRFDIKDVNADPSTSTKPPETVNEIKRPKIASEASPPGSAPVLGASARFQFPEPSARKSSLDVAPASLPHSNHDNVEHSPHEIHPEDNRRELPEPMEMEQNEKAHNRHPSTSAAQSGTSSPAHRTEPLQPQHHKPVGIPTEPLDDQNQADPRQQSSSESDEKEIKLSNKDLEQRLGEERMRELRKFLPLLLDCKKFTITRVDLNSSFAQFSLCGTFDA